MYFVHDIVLYCFVAEPSVWLPSNWGAAVCVLGCLPYTLQLQTPRQDSDSSAQAHLPQPSHLCWSVTDTFLLTLCKRYVLGAITLMDHPLAVI